MSLNTKTSSYGSRTSSFVARKQIARVPLTIAAASNRMVDRVARALRGYGDDAQEV